MTDVHQTLKSRTLIALAFFTVGLTVPLGQQANAQVPPLAVAAAPLAGRVASFIGSVLLSYAAEKGIDQIIGAGSALRDTLTAVRDQLHVQARKNAANRQILLRQAAILDGLQSELKIVLTRRPTDAEAAEIRNRTAQAIEDLKRVQADHDRRIGRLEEGQDSLRQHLAAISADVQGRGTQSAPPSTTQAPASSRDNTRTDDAPHIASRDMPSLRVVLRSVLPVKVRVAGGVKNAFRLSFDFVSRESQRVVLVALNAAPQVTEAFLMYYGPGSKFKGRCEQEVLSSLADAGGGVWRVASVSGVSTVAAGCSYNSRDIVSLLQRQDRIGGSRAIGEAEFAVGMPTSLEPGQSVSVVVTFYLKDGTAGSSRVPDSFQLASELIVGIIDGSKRSYSLRTLVLDRIDVPPS